MNGLGNFKLEPQQPGASAGVSEFSNASSLTHAQGGSMGNGMNTMGGGPNEHPGPKGGSMGELNKMNGGGASVHETDDGQHGYIHGDGSSSTAVVSKLSPRGGRSPSVKRRSPPPSPRSCR